MNTYCWQLIASNVTSDPTVIASNFASNFASNKLVIASEVTSNKPAITSNIASDKPVITSNIASNRRSYHQQSKMWLAIQGIADNIAGNFAGDTKNC